MTESEQRKRLRIVVSAAALVSVTLTVWVIYAVRTRQYLVLEQLPWFHLVMGLLLLSLGAFFAALAFHHRDASGEARAHLALRAVSSVLFGLTLLLHRLFGLAQVFWLVELALALVFLGFLVSLFSVLRTLDRGNPWDKRNRPG